jgi:hypothetical protein
MAFQCGIVRGIFQVSMQTRRLHEGNMPVPGFECERNFPAISERDFARAMPSVEGGNLYCVLFRTVQQGFFARLENKIQTAPRGRLPSCIRPMTRRGRAVKLVQSNEAKGLCRPLNNFPNV